MVCVIKPTTKIEALKLTLKMYLETLVRLSDYAAKCLKVFQIDFRTVSVLNKIN